MSFLYKSDPKDWEIMVLKTKLICKETKRSTKAFFTNSTNLNLLTGTLVFGFPIIFCVSCLGENKQKELNELIETTTPGMVHQNNNVSWETFQKTNFLPIPKNAANISLKVPSETESTYLENNFPELVYQNSISNLEIWGHSLRFELNENWQAYKKQFFLGLKIESTGLTNQKYFIYPSREKIDSNSYKNIYGQQNPDTINLKYYQLDEYPLKLENNWKDTKLEGLKLSIKKREITKSVSFPMSTKQFLAKKIDIDQPYLFGLKKINPVGSFEKRNQKVALNTAKKKLTQNLRELNNPQLKWQGVTKKIRAIQAQTNYKFTLGQVNTSKQELLGKLNPNRNLLASHQLLNILNQNGEIHRNILRGKTESQIFANRPPLMSGFNYPDLSKTAVQNYNLLNPKMFFKRNGNDLNTQIKVYYGSHFIYPEFNLNRFIEPLPFYFHYHPTSFTLISGKICYKGPGIIFTDSYQSNSYLGNAYLSLNQSNLKSILTRPDPRFSQPVYSLGKFLDKNKKTHKKSKPINQTFQDAKQTVLLKKYLNVKRLLKTRSWTFPLFNYKSEFVVPYLTAKEWQNWSTKKSKTQPSVIKKFPLRKIQSLKNSDAKIIYDKLDYQNPSWVFKFINAKILNYEDLLNQSGFSSAIDFRKYQNVLYQKKRNLYAEKLDHLNPIQTQFDNLNGLVKVKPKVFRDVWEPIHQNSWLTINKFLFALLIVYIVRQLLAEYGKELAAYLLDLVASLGVVDEFSKEELAPEAVPKTYRLIKQSQKDLKNMTGIDHLFTDIVEIVWFLRNLGRPFQLTKLVTKGVLLVGAPGTGKTLLVQAIAGEAELPVLVQSASSLHRLEGRGPEKLKILFETARELGPCIIFFDELDSIGEKRSKVIENPIDQTTLLSLLYWNGKQKYKTYDYGIPFTKKKYNFNPKKLSPSENDGGNINVQSNRQEQTSDQLGLLMQLLIELDGLQINRNLLVIGATNRPEILDPALIRPGRLSKTLEIGLPNKKSRIAICQLYSRFLGVSRNICWNSIAEETTGLSGADLATIINQSSIQAILLGTKHTQETINSAIDKVLGAGNNVYKDPKFIQRVFSTADTTEIKTNLQKHFLVCSAYNEAGLKLLEYSLPNHKNPIVAKLVATTINSRYKKQSLDYFIKNQQLTTQYKHQFRTKIIALLAGKTAEFIFLMRSKFTKWDQFQTLLNLGTSQLQNVSHLIYFTISKESFFPSYQPSLNFNLVENQNQIEHVDQDLMNLFTSLAGEYEKDLLSIEFSKYKRFQRWTTKSWWQVQVSNLDKLRNTKKSSWYRLFVMHPDNSTPSDERLSADNYFHHNNLYFLTRTFSFNDQFQRRRELLYKTILMDSFNLTSDVLQARRDLLDLIVIFLIQKRVLNENQLTALFKNFSLIIHKQLMIEPKLSYVSQLKKNTLLG